MKNLPFLFLLAFISFIFSDCASIVSKSSYPLMINTSPSDATVIIKDGKGNITFQGKSPTSVKLKSGSGFFKKAQYTITIEADGFDRRIVPVNYKLDGWYWGNILFGGVLGMLVVDPATGAMYKLEEEYMNIELSKSNVFHDEPTLKVYDLAEIPKAWQTKLQRINP